MLPLLNKMLLKKALRPDARAGIALADGSFALAIVRRGTEGNRAMRRVGRNRDALSAEDAADSDLRA